MSDRPPAGPCPAVVVVVVVPSAWIRARGAPRRSYTALEEPVGGPQGRHSGVAPHLLHRW